jgi:hypothetical protein
MWYLDGIPKQTKVKIKEVNMHEVWSLVHNNIAVLTDYSQQMYHANVRY